jgi:hypothetical protein
VLLAEAQPNDCVVVAVATHGIPGKMALYIANADPARLVVAARALLLQARETLEDTNGRAARNTGLWADITDAICFLPDPDTDHGGGGLPR